MGKVAWQRAEPAAAASLITPQPGTAALFDPFVTISIQPVGTLQVRTAPVTRRHAFADLHRAPSATTGAPVCSAASTRAPYLCVCQIGSIFMSSSLALLISPVQLCDSATTMSGAPSRTVILFRKPTTGCMKAQKAALFQTRLSSSFCPAAG